MKQNQIAPSSTKSTGLHLGIIGGIAALCYVLILVFSFQFEYGKDHKLRPIPQVLILFSVAGVGYLLAMYAVFRHKAVDAGGAKKLLWLILLVALGHRLILLPSRPIQEIDYFRYLWDGQVLASGTNPYRFSPQQIDKWHEGGADRGDRKALWDMAHQAPAVATIFKNVHHRHVPTVYPPLAQVVFAVSSLLTPAQAPLWLHVLLLKILLLLFDAGTVLLLIAILRRLGKPATWGLAYAWCPLVLKEISNSAHLDSIAVFFTTLCVFVLVDLWKRTRAGDDFVMLKMGCASMICLAAGVLAKSYPLVLLPVVTGFLMARLRWRVTVPVTVFVLVVALGYAPFLHMSSPPAFAPPAEIQQASAGHTPWKGLTTFLTQWQMNDFLFMIVHENLRQPGVGTERFYVIVPHGIRQTLHTFASQGFASYGPPMTEIAPSFLLTQGLMATIIGALTLFWAVRVARRAQPELLLQGVFLVLIWSWLLSATQNPWYLTWSLPFILFAGRRSYFLLPLLALCYYVRFYIEYQYWPDRSAVQWFDYGIVWLEYLPFFLLLGLEMLEDRWLSRSTAVPVAETTERKRKPSRKRKKPATRELSKTRRLAS